MIYNIQTKPIGFIYFENKFTSKIKKLINTFEMPIFTTFRSGQIRTEHLIHLRHAGVVTASLIRDYSERSLDKLGIRSDVLFVQSESEIRLRLSVLRQRRIPKAKSHEKEPSAFSKQSVPMTLTFLAKDLCGY